MFRYALYASVGAVIGSLGRYEVGLAIPHNSTTDFPWATFSVNVLGALIIGVLSQRDRVMTNDGLRHFCVTGVLGGFTTFSALAVETIQLSSRPIVCVVYVLATFGVGLAATSFGRKVTSQ